ncbi:AMP-binding protein [Haladaptatus halobius]|uniref:AMP-binding protein n=1 Tax=Haladaptatus halobius TaxID=2884875 RepID=UPI001D0A0DAA|nr:AMP-binding protein [Haladaptatus halobius]
MDFLHGKTVQDLWRERVALSGDDRFLITDEKTGVEQSYDYAEFNDIIDRTARAFSDELGIEKGDKVTIHLPNCPEYLQVWFALLKLGAVSVHSNTNHTVREVNYTIENSDSEAVITSPTYADLVDEACEGTAVETTVYGRVNDEEVDGVQLDEIVANADPDLPDVDIDGEDVAQIIFTSGTTSDPKGVLHTHANLLYAGERASKHTALNAADRMLTALPVFHVNAQSISVLSSLTVGCELVLVEEFKASEYIDQLRRHRATVTSLIGTQVRALLAQPEQGTDDDNDLREIFFAINVTDDEKERFEERFGAPLLNGYGLSETMTIVSMAPVHSDRSWPAIGRPAFDREVYIVDDDGNPVDTGERGEIAVGGKRGRNLMKAYYEMPEKTEETFTDEGWLLTGDFGRFDENGHLYFVDRKKNIIESRGENVSEAEVEGVLENHSKVEEVGVIGVPHDIYGEAVKALVKRADDDLTEAELREYAAENLAKFKQPEEIVFIEEFPRTSIGKIEKSTLRDAGGVPEEMGAE